jgi:DNA repair protein RadC
MPKSRLPLSGLEHLVMRIVWRRGKATADELLVARPVETFGLLALDARHRLRREAVVSVGCLTASLVHPREVFQEAVVSRAAALVLFHNHPSGDPEPSAEDLALTRRLAAAGSLMGIEVLDHLVLGAGRYVSLKERGVL